MQEPFVLSIIFVTIISLISFLGVLTLSFNIEKLKKVLFLLVSLSCGTLLGGAFLHLIPESIEMSAGNAEKTSLLVLVGILIFFSLEKIVCWRHCHVPTSSQHPHPLAIINLIGDGLHNFIDGSVIAAGFLAGPHIGIPTAIAVVLHEIPQEIGDFGVLVYAGYSRKKALIMNFLSALVSFLGVFLVFLLNRNDNLINFLLPITAGGFIYIATADLLPELQKEINYKKIALQFILIILGVAIMSLIR